MNLPSGNRLEIGEVPFADAKRLYQAVLSELKNVNIRMDDVADVNFIKNLVCASIDSKPIEQALEPCLRRSIYEGKKITEETFEPVAAREDYFDVCGEVIKETILPFSKSLFAQFRNISNALARLHESNGAKGQTN